MADRLYHPDGSLPPEGWIFVFGSNLDGVHRKGAALVARQRYGAVYGIGAGRVGSSYAIPTKQTWRDPGFPIARLKLKVDKFLEYARENPQAKFFITRVGCGLAGHSDIDVAPLFRDAPANCSLPSPWKGIIEHPPRNDHQQRTKVRIMAEAEKARTMNLGEFARIVDTMPGSGYPIIFRTSDGKRYEASRVTAVLIYTGDSLMRGEAVIELREERSAT